MHNFCTGLYRQYSFKDGKRLDLSVHMTKLRCTNTKYIASQRQHTTRHLVITAGLDDCGKTMKLGNIQGTMIYWSRLQVSVHYSDDITLVRVQHTCFAMLFLPCLQHPWSCRPCGSFGWTSRDSYMNFRDPIFTGLEIWTYTHSFSTWVHQLRKCIAVRT